MSEFKNELHQQIIFYQNQPSFLDVILGKKKAAIQEKKIVIFGAGVLGKQAALAFKHTGVIIDRFIDNNSEKWNLEYKGIKCQSPESLSEDARDCFVLISPATDTSKIVAQLKNIGLTEDQILWNQEQRVKFGNSYYYYLANCLCSMLSSIQNPFEIINRDIEEISRIHKHLADEKSKKIFLSKLALTCAGENFGALNNYLENHSDTIIENRMKFGNDATNHFPNPEFEYYFRQDFLAFSDDEIYVDVGAADGDTIKPFLTEMLCRKKTIKKIYAFEPDPFSFQELEKNLKAFSFIEPHRIGVTQEALVHN